VNRPVGLVRDESITSGVPDVAELSVALERTASWLRRALRNSEWNAVALSTLDELARGGPRRVTELAALERTSQPGMTGILARLAAAGLVRRDPDPTDGRATLITVTEAGSREAGEDARHPGLAGPFQGRELGDAARAAASQLVEREVVS
jgi:DNA-binding MarR family transcriptional regulator